MKELKRPTTLIPAIAELRDIEQRRDPHPILKQLRETTPIRYDEAYDCFDVFTHEEAARILKDPVTFSSQFSRVANNGTASIIMTDPPRHQEFRGLVDNAFTPKRVQDLGPMIQNLVTDLLDQVADQGRMETVEALAGPLPVMVIAELLGVPKEDRWSFKELSDVLIEGLTDDSEEAFEALKNKQLTARETLRAYFAGLVEQRRQEPREDLISIVVKYNDERQVISEAELQQFCTTLLVAGHETTTNLITSGVRVLAERPDVLEQLANDSSLVPAFVEEVLRCYPPSTRNARMATKEVEIRGHVIQSGQIVNTWTVAANRDPEKFEDPETFRLDRTSNPHLSFGFGIHFCLGAPLARLETQIFFTELTKRLTSISRADNEPLDLRPFPMFTSLKSFHVTFEKRSE